MQSSVVTVGMHLFARCQSIRCPTMMVLVGLVVMSAAASRQDPPANDPAAIIQDSVNQALKVLRDTNFQGGAKRSQRHSQLRALADKVIDWQEMAQRCLGFHWQKIDRSQQQEFLKVFEGLLANYYLNEIDNFQGTETIQLLGTRKSQSQVVVQTMLTTSSHERPPIDYYMEQRPVGWRVFDLSIEGVSLVANYRDRFSRFLVNHTFSQLIDVLKAQQ